MSKISLTISIRTCLFDNNTKHLFNNNLEVDTLLVHMFYIFTHSIIYITYNDKCLNETIIRYAIKVTLLYMENEFY